MTPSEQPQGEVTQESAGRSPSVSPSVGTQRNEPMEVDTPSLITQLAAAHPQTDMSAGSRLWTGNQTHPQPTSLSADPSQSALPPFQAPVSSAETYQNALSQLIMAGQSSLHAPSSSLPAAAEQHAIPAASLATLITDKGPYVLVPYNDYHTLQHNAIQRHRERNTSATPQASRLPDRTSQQTNGYESDVEEDDSPPLKRRKKKTFAETRMHVCPIFTLDFSLVDNPDHVGHAT